jgi:uncharacterized protein YeaO (DUF488 family)
MKTSYFYQIQKGVTGGVSISVGKPKYVEIDAEFKQLAPSWNLLKAFKDEKIDEAGYVKRFNYQLSKMNAKMVVDHLHFLTDGEEPVLMCHCGKDKFCHRHLVAEWLEKETGQKIEECGMGLVNRANGRIVGARKEVKDMLDLL